MTRTIDMAAATARVNAVLAVRMGAGSTSYLSAICDERNILAQCIADEALRADQLGDPCAHYGKWLDEYRACCQMRDRTMSAYRQEQAARRAALAAAQLAEAAAS